MRPFLFCGSFSVHSGHMPFIPETERLFFRPHLPGDLDDYCKMEMNIDVRRYVGGYARSRKEAEHRFPARQQQQLPTDPLALWATVLKSQNVYIGRCGLIPQKETMRRYGLPENSVSPWHLPKTDRGHFCISKCEIRRLSCRLLSESLFERI